MHTALTLLAVDNFEIAENATQVNMNSWAILNKLSWINNNNKWLFFFSLASRSLNFRCCQLIFPSQLHSMSFRRISWLLLLSSLIALQAKWFLCAFFVTKSNIIINFRFAYFPHRLHSIWLAQFASQALAKVHRFFQQTNWANRKGMLPFRWMWIK